jgi:hypothetical protein
MGEPSAIPVFKEVKNPSGHVIGTVKRLIRNDLGEVAVFFFKDALGLGKKCYLIPSENFIEDQSTKQLIIKKDLNHLRNAPSFNDNEWPENIFEYLKVNLEYWKTNR